MAERACCARWCRRGAKAWQRCPGAGRHQISRREGGEAKRAIAFARDSDEMDELRSFELVALRLQT